MEDKLENTLNKKSIKPTAMRSLVLKFMLEHGTAVSVSDLEGALDTADKSTLFRTLKTFKKNNLVHTSDDGSGKLKYVLCTETFDCETGHQHFHFFCLICSETYCLPMAKLPAIKLPSNFKVSEANLVLKGVCGECAAKKR